MSRKTWKDLAPKQAANKASGNHDSSLSVEQLGLDNLVAVSPKISALLEEQKRLADNMERLTGGTLNADNDPRFPVTALDERRKEIEEWSTRKQAKFEKYKQALPKQGDTSKTITQSATKKSPNIQAFNRPLPEKWDQRRDRMTKAALKAKKGISAGTQRLEKFDNKLSSVSKQLSEFKEKAGGELPPELTSLDEKLNAAREKSASIKALTRKGGLRSKVSENKTLANWMEKRDRAQTAIRAAGTANKALSSVGSKFNRPRNGASKGLDKERPKRKKENNSSDLDRRREQSVKKRNEKKAEQDRMDRRNERANARRKEKRANRYA